MSTQFPFPHPLFCIISSYPFAIPFGFMLCNMFSTLTAIINWVHNSVPGHKLFREHRLSKSNAISLMSLHWEDESGQDIHWSYPVQLGCFTSKCSYLLHATNAQECRQFWSPRYFLLKYTTPIKTSQMVFLLSISTGALPLEILLFIRIPSTIIR